MTLRIGAWLRDTTLVKHTKSSRCPYCQKNIKGETALLRHIAKKHKHGK
jgi:uncharacterized C2H2 Zn-finger protein